MRAQVTLIPVESKKLIAKAVAKMDVVQEAFSRGTIAIHPSTSTIFIVQELLGIIPDSKIWVCGVVTPKGTCASAEQREAQAKQGRWPPEKAFFSWVIRDGKIKYGMALGDIVNGMGPEDVYIKGPNAVDVDNNVGVLIGNPVSGGTIGLVMKTRKSRGFHVILPVGLEKLIPVPIKTAAREANQKRFLKYSIGNPCGLYPVIGGTVVTETQAIEVLSGATAIPISAGGLAGGEGAVTMVIRGEADQVEKAIKYVESVKGAKYPRKLNVAVCGVCRSESCGLKDRQEPWMQNFE